MKGEAGISKEWERGCIFELGAETRAVSLDGSPRQADLGTAEAELMPQAPRLGFRRAPFPDALASAAQMVARLCSKVVREGPTPDGPLS